MATRPTRPPRPQVNRNAGTAHQGSSGDLSFWDGAGAALDGATTIFTDPGKAIGETAGVLNGGARHIPGVAQAEDTAKAVGKLSDVLTDPNTWIRTGEVLLGGLLMLAGIAIVARELGMRELANVAGKVVKNARPK